MNIQTALRLLLTLPALALLAACGADPAPSSVNESAPKGAQDPPAQAQLITDAAADVDPQSVFLDALRKHCGLSYAGQIVANTPAEPNDPFAGKPLVMHVRECSEDAIKIPFHVGDDRSRTWVISRTESGLRLKHDHRHEDGSEDALTQYGGDTAFAGSALRQEFPVDAYSIAMFEQQGRSVSISNTWAIEIAPGQRSLYELSRPNGRLFQVEFDLTRPVANPPTPWGHPPLPGDAATALAEP